MVMVPPWPDTPGTVAVFKTSAALAARLNVVLPRRAPDVLQK